MSLGSAFVLVVVAGHYYQGRSAQRQLLRLAEAGLFARPSSRISDFDDTLASQLFRMPGPFAAANLAAHNLQELGDHWASQVPLKDPLAGPVALKARVSGSR